MQLEAKTKDKKKVIKKEDQLRTPTKYVSLTVSLKPSVTANFTAHITKFRECVSNLHSDTYSIPPHHELSRYIFFSSTTFNCQLTDFMPCHMHCVRISLYGKTWYPAARKWLVKSHVESWCTLCRCVNFPSFELEGFRRDACSERFILLG